MISNARKYEKSCSSSSTVVVVAVGLAHCERRRATEECAEKKKLPIQYRCLYVCLQGGRDKSSCIQNVTHISIVNFGISFCLHCRPFIRVSRLRAINISGDDGDNAPTINNNNNMSIVSVVIFCYLC